MKLRTELALAATGILIAPALVVFARVFYEMWVTPEPSGGVLVWHDTPDGDAEWKARKLRLDTQRWKYVRTSSGDWEPVPIGHGGEAKDGMEYALREHEVGIRQHGVDFGPEVTMAEYEAWVAAGSPEDIDAFLESVR